MRFLKGILGIGIMMLALNGMAQRSDGHKDSSSPDERAKHMTEKMTEHLDLNEKQQVLMADINLNYARQAQKIKESSKSKEQSKEKIKALRDKKKKEMEAVLTQEQMDKLKEFHEKKKGQKKEKMEERKKQ